LLFVAESQVSVEECGGWDVTAPSSPVKFVENPQRFRVAAGASVSVDEHSQHSRTAIRQGSSRLICQFELLIILTRVEAIDGRPTET
jgi:hypothetical protein